MDEATGERRRNLVYNIVSRVLLVNMAAIHTTVCYNFTVQV